MQWAAVDMCLTKGDEMRPGFYKEVRTPSPPPSYHAQLGVPPPPPQGEHMPKVQPRAHDATSLAGQSVGSFCRE